MRPITLLFAFLFSTYAFAKAYTEPSKDIVQSTITEVTVYLSGAQITRTTTVAVLPGTTEFKLENLSPHIDENSIQVSGLDDAAILSINYGLDFLSAPKFPEKIEALKAQQEQLRIKLLRLNSELDGLNKEEDILNTNKRLGTETIEVDVVKLKALAAYNRTRLTEIRNAKIDADLKREVIQEELKTIEKQFREFNVSDETQKGIITLKLNSDRATSLALKVSYIVSEAGWFPMYDLRAKTVNEPLDLSYKSHVYQKTGVDWSAVKLTLSTGDPNTNNTKPEVDTKYLNFVNPNSFVQQTRATQAYNYKYNPNVRTVSGVVYDDTGLPLPGANVIVKGTSTGTQTDFDGKYTLEVSDGSELAFSYVGFSSENLPVYASQMNVHLEADNELDEVVVTAQGIRREKRALGYAVSAVETEDVSRVLNGKASGVYIRGQNSIPANSKALYIVDGVPFDMNTNSVKSLDSENIDEVKVLKGRSATTLYGSSGRNGVILITTKKGKGMATATGQSKIEAITTTRFEITKPYSIATDGDVTVIEVDSFKVPATFAYFTAPVLNENVFLTAEIKNWEQFSLLPGEANIYFEGSFAGKTFINPLATTEALTVSLGVDPSVIVKRKQLDNFKDRSFTGNTKIVSNEWGITVKNTKSKAITLTLLDRIPISQNKDIKIVDAETPEAQYDEETGIATWTLTLQPQESKTQNLKYTVRYPRFKSINL